MLKRADGPRTLVLVAGSEETMGRAVRAWENPADRAVLTRNLDGPNFLQYRLSVPTYGDGASRDMATELAWRREGNTTVIDSFSDLDAMGVTPMTSGMEDRPVPLFGSGEPFVIETIDLPYFFSVAMPGVADPVEGFVSLMEASVGERIPFQFRSDVLAVLSGSRATIGVFMNSADIVPNTAYLALDMKTPDVLGKYFALAGMLLSPVEVEGWESALSESVDDGIDVTLARSGDRILLGIGNPEEYANVDENTALGAMFREVMAEEEDGDMLFEVIDRLNLRAFESLSVVQTAPERAESRIVWSE